MESGNSLFNLELVKYFSSAGRRQCPPYVTLLSMSSSIKYKIMVSLTIVFIGMVTQGGQDFTTLAVL